MSVNPNTSSGSGDDGSVLPSWFPTSFSGFRNLVIGVVSSWIVVGVLDIGLEIVDAALEVFASMRAAGSAIGSAITVAFRPVTALPWIVLEIAGGTIETIAASSGPAAPFVVPLLWAGTVVAIVLMLRVLVSIVRSLVGVLPFT